MGISNIPMPDNAGSFGRGFHITDNLMQEIIQRAQLKQKTEHEKAALEQARKNHLESLAIQKMAQSRLGQMLPYQIQAYKDAHAKMDPNYALNQFKALQDFITGGGQPMTGGSKPQETQQPQPTQIMGEGKGMFSPQGMLDAQQTPPVNAIAGQPTATAGGQMGGGLNMDMLRQHPMLRGFAKEYLKFDPLAAVPQTPEEKEATALDLYAKKQELSSKNKGGDTPTNTVLTQNQQAIQGIDTVLPMIDELITDPSKVYGRFDFDPSKKAAYNAKTSGMIDTLVAAQSLPKVQASLDLVEQQIRRGTNESDAAYINRLKDLRKDLVKRREKSQAVIKSRKVNTEELPPMIEGRKTLNGKNYEKINGEWHEV